MKTNHLLSIMKVIFWITFIGLCIKAGALVFAFIHSLILDSAAAPYFTVEHNLGEIYEQSKWHYVTVISFIIVIAIQKAYLAYLVIKIFIKFNLENPFHPKVTELIMKISHIALGTGVVAIIAEAYSKSLLQKGYNLPHLDFDGGEFLFLAGIIFIIALVFQKGVEMKAENELTI